MIFISYKREPDRPLAQLIQAQLAARGFKSWLDVTFSPSETWVNLIDQAIAEATDVIVILSPEAVHSDDTYVRHEVELAVRLRKTIVPVTTPGFVWPKYDSSPDWLNDVRRFHAVAASWDYPEAFADRLLSFCSVGARKRTLLERLSSWRWRSGA